MSVASADAPPRARAERIRDRLAALARIGADPAGGVSRLAYTPEERAAHDLLDAWAEEAGRRRITDEAGNTVVVWEEGEPYFLLGSHLDTVVQGGAYDGTAGVVGALEAAELAGGALERGLRVVAFAGEEGARFGRPNLGSAAASGFLPREALARLRDAAGTTLADAAGRLGLDPLGVRPWLGPEVACYLEIHIEQGRVLEAEAARIGLVDAIAGSVRLRLHVRGRADHSGATPMHLRADALAAASELVLAAEAAGRRYRSTVVTVGRVEVVPNNVTTVPGEVTLWVDVRDVDADVQRATAASVLDEARRIGAARTVEVSGEIISSQPPVVLEAWPRRLAHEECDGRAVRYRVLSSGAGHDAAVVARYAPATMIFVPCVDGISHSPREQASPADIAVAAELVADVVRRADRVLPGS